MWLAESTGPISCSQIWFLRFRTGASIFKTVHQHLEQEKVVMYIAIVIYSPLDSSVFIFSFYNIPDSGFCDEVATAIPEDHSNRSNQQVTELCEYAAPFHTQIVVLLGRTWRTVCREKVQFFFRFTQKQLSLLFPKIFGLTI